MPSKSTPARSRTCANNPFAGIADDTTWNFTTATAPQAVTVAAVTGSHGGDEYATGMTALVNGSGMTRPDLADPSTWTVSYNNYPDEWMGNYLVGAGNSKLAWVAFDLGASTALHQLYLWNIRYSGGVAGTATYNLYYADSPTVALPAQPNKGAYSVTGLTPQGDYDFTSGGWTKFNTSGTLSAPQAGNSIVDLSGISARYVALEILTNHGDTYLGGRVGFLETAFTRAVTPTVGYTAWAATNGTTAGTRPRPRPRRRPQRHRVLPRRQHQHHRLHHAARRDQHRRHAQRHLDQGRRLHRHLCPPTSSWKPPPL